MKVVYKQGITLHIADFLSRASLPVRSSSQCETDYCIFSLAEEMDVYNSFEIVNLCENLRLTDHLANREHWFIMIMFVRSKFMRVRSLWKTCARAHAHSLEGTLVENHWYRAKFFVAERINEKSATVPLLLIFVFFTPTNFLFSTFHTPIPVLFSYFVAYLSSYHEKAINALYELA